MQKNQKKEDAPKEGKDGTYDVYVKSDSDSEHSHDRVDKNGNLLDNYHDSMINRLFNISEEELSNMIYLSNEHCIVEIEKELKAKTKIRRR